MRQTFVHLTEAKDAAQEYANNVGEPIRVFESWDGYIIKRVGGRTARDAKLRQHAVMLPKRTPDKKETTDGRGQEHQGQEDGILAEAAGG